MVLDCEFSENELNCLPEFIYGRGIHFTSLVGICPLMETNTEAYYILQSRTPRGISYSEGID